MSRFACISGMIPMTENQRFDVSRIRIADTEKTERV